MENSQWSFFSPCFPESAIKTNTLLVKEAATERKEEMKRDGCSAWQRVKQFPYQHLPTSTKQMRGYPVLLCRIPLNSLGQLSISQVQMPVMRIKNQVLCPRPRRRQGGYMHTDAQLQQTQSGANCYLVYRAAGFSIFCMRYLIMISIRILTSNSIKILQLLPLSKELPKSVLESRWALLSVPMKILFTMLYISRCDIISGTSHSPHLQWTTVLICVLGGEDLAAESHDVTLMVYYFTIACK